MRLTIDPQGVRILVVDDDPYITDLVAVGLRFVGFDVDTAGDGRDALEKVAASAPDLVVLDISMPGIDGLDVVQRLRRDGVNMPVVFLTAGCSRRTRPWPARRRGRLHHETVQPRRVARAIEAILRRCLRPTGGLVASRSAT